MWRIIKSRYFIITFGMICLCTFLVYSLWQVAVVQGAELESISQDRKMRNVVLYGERGKILDRNGLPLAYNQKSYNVEFFRENVNTKRSERYRPLYTEIMQKTIAVIEKNGDKTIDTFAIAKTPDDNFAFDWGPISTEAAAKREENWRKNMGGYDAKNEDKTYKYTAEDIYYKLRKFFYIPEELDYAQARKLLSIWQEVQLSSYRSHIPVTIAYNVPIETVSELETRSIELDAIRTSEADVRIYPKGQTAAHVVGFMGKMTDADLATKMVEEQGYSLEDLVGKDGIEYSMEKYLTCNTKERKGETILESGQKGNVTRVLETTPAKDGLNVVTTLDLPLQQVAETALKNNIEEINNEQHRLLIENQDKYSKIAPDLTKINLAKMGACIVMDVTNGDVLAIANYPSFDPNDFTGGIDFALSQQLYNDPALPLYNKAIASRAMPGSIFKMLPGIAGLEEKVMMESNGKMEPLTIHYTIDDAGPYTKSTQGKLEGAPKCWTKYPAKHKEENIVRALKDSCNYYFFDVSHALGIDKLVEWGHKFGLDQKTQIELPGETTGQVGGQKVLYDKTKITGEDNTGLPGLVKREINKLLRSYCEQMGTEINETSIATCSERLLQLVDENEQIGEQIREIMREELGIPQAVSKSNYWHMQISSLLTELRWNPNQTIRTGIGQAVVQVTPIAVARYFSALLNGGTVYNAHIVKRIIDENGKTVEDIKPSVLTQLNLDPQNVQAIQEGLQGVVSPEDGGTAGDYFKGFEYLHILGGKTGTAQVSYSQSNIDLQNTSWFTAYVPLDKPEIAIVVYIPNGLSGSKSSSTVRDIVKFYMDRQSGDAVENLPAVNGALQ